MPVLVVEVVLEEEGEEEAVEAVEEEEYPRGDYPVCLLSVH